MQLSSAPYKFTYPWAANAASPQYLTTLIPVVTSSPAASQQQGFPPATANPSGPPPNINDFNGAFNYLSLWAQWLQAGSPVVYDSTFSANNGGYPQSAILASALYPGVLWVSLVDNNTTDPDTGGANWSQYPPHGGFSNYAAGTYSWTCPAGVTRVWVEVWGGGGGATGGAGSGGAGGGYAAGWLAVVPGTSYTYIVGNGGTGTGYGGPSTAGGTSSITNGTATIQATGGSPGLTGPGAGGQGTGGQINIQGQGGTDLTDTGAGYSTGIVGNAIGGNAPRGGMGGLLNEGSSGSSPTSPGGGGGSNANVNVGQSGATGGVALTW
jgi:hypothetical protein